MEQAGRKLVPCGGFPVVLRRVVFYWWPAPTIHAV